ncbi:MAG: GSCFA domain-containing protein [Ginsengibacter sp.]
MDFFLPFHLPTLSFRISYNDKILLVGSCFSEEIGNRMNDLKFNVLQNPNGILYDPLSIVNALSTYIENKPYKTKNLFELNGLWHSWQHHSIFSGLNQNEVLEKINSSQSEAHHFLKEANYLIITLGTAFKYQLKNTGEGVANCHKAPAANFEKTLLSTEHIISSSLSLLTDLEKFNPALKIIFTISPAKHVKDGVVENNRSKARLIEAVHAIAEQKQSAFYFPSYELVTDVLRDYRFYKTDLVHPNDAAVNFVFEKFCDNLLDDSAKNIMEEINKILDAANHKPFAKESAAHQKFIATQIKNIQKIENDYPFINLSREKEYFLKSSLG